jgi:hypothetical protein
MTTPTQSTGRLFNLLALYAALDRAVMEFHDPGIAATVEGFLPGTTGESQRGWSRDLEHFLGRDLPEVNTALSEIAQAAPLTRPQLSRLVYVVGALAHITTYKADNEQVFAEALRLARPQRMPRPEAQVAEVAGTDPGLGLLDLLEEHFSNSRDWHDVTKAAVQAGYLDPIVATVPLCNACLTTQDGIECVLVDTRFEDSTVSLEDVKAILDPQNWDKTAGEFFCNMTSLGVRNSDPYKGWGRIRETVGVWCGSGLPELVTDLKYYKADYSNPDQAVLQYDLDDPFPGVGDGHVTVDKGWLKATRGTSTDPNVGVTVATRKVVHIDPLSPVLQKVFVCVMGYGQAAMEMLLGHAHPPPANAVPWSDPPAPLQAPPAPLAAASAGQPGSAQAGNGAGAAPTTAAGLAVSMMSDFLAEVTHDSSDFAAKCANKQLTVDDFATLSANLAAKMASQPWRFLQRLSELPPSPPTGGPSQGGTS